MQYENENYQKNVKSLLIYSKTVTKINSRIGLFIKMYIIEIFNKESFNPFEIKLILKEIENEKNKLNIKKEDKIVSVFTFEEFSEFLSKIFDAVDKEDKTGEITYSTAALFRMIADLIVLINIWKPLEVEEEWGKLSKQCF